MSELKNSHQAAQSLTSKLLAENKKKADQILQNTLAQLSCNSVSSMIIVTRKVQS